MLKISAATATDAGSSSYNQDRGGVTVRDTEALLTVFDGHGTYGEEMAAWAQDHFHGAGVDMPFSELFTAADNLLRDRFAEHLRGMGLPFVAQEGGFYAQGYYGTIGGPIRGGTSATAVRIARDGSMSVGQVGDSEARYYDTEDDGVTVCADHSPNNLSEFARIHAAHPRTAFLFGSPQGVTTRPVFVPGPDGSMTFNPAGGAQYADVRQSWSSYLVATAPNGGREQLAMTRALGDFHLKRHGVIATPHTAEVAAPAAGVTRAIVVASDGLWDGCQYADVGRIVRRPDLLGNAPAAAAALVEFGLAKSAEVFGAAGGMDNITVAVAYVSG